MQEVHIFLITSSHAPKMRKAWYRYILVCQGKTLEKKTDVQDVTGQNPESPGIYASTGNCAGAKNRRAEIQRAAVENRQGNKEEAPGAGRPEEDGTSAIR